MDTELFSFHGLARPCLFSRQYLPSLEGCLPASLSAPRPEGSCYLGGATVKHPYTSSTFPHLPSGSRPPLAPLGSQSCWLCRQAAAPCQPGAGRGLVGWLLWGLGPRTPVAPATWPPRPESAFIHLTFPIQVLILQELAFSAQRLGVHTRLLLLGAPRGCFVHGGVALLGFLYSSSARKEPA